VFQCRTGQHPGAHMGAAGGMEQFTRLVQCPDSTALI